MSGDGVTPGLVIYQMTEIIKKHPLRQPSPPQDFRCECGWTSEYPVSEHPRHVAEMIEHDELLDLMRRKLIPDGEPVDMPPVADLPGEAARALKMTADIAEAIERLR